jgi:MobC-like protein
MTKTIFTFPPAPVDRHDGPTPFQIQQMEEPKRNKGGRPLKESREKKNFKIELKLNQEDFDRLERQYQNSGYRNKSDMYYDMLFHKTLRQKDADTLAVLQEIQELTRQVKGIGAAYSQVVSRLDGLATAGVVAGELQKLSALSGQLQEKEKEMFHIIIRLREKWLRAS